MPRTQKRHIVERATEGGSCRLCSCANLLRIESERYENLVLKMRRIRKKVFIAICISNQNLHKIRISNSQ